MSGVSKKVKEKTPRAQNNKAFSSIQSKIHTRNTSISNANNEKPQTNSVTHQNLIDKLKKMEENIERSRFLYVNVNEKYTLWNSNILNEKFILQKRGVGGYPKQ